MVSIQNRDKEERHFSDLIQMAPLEFQSPIITAWQAIKDIYQVQLHVMPQPVWREREYEETGSQVWERIKSHLAEKRDANSISIYIHIPFCKDKKCGFCDCLSVPMNQDSPIRQFIDTLIKEIKLWSCLPGLNQKSVSVIYFGGGTPNSLPDHLFEQIMQELFRGFAVNSETQISVECPGKLLTPKKLDFLESLHVTRLSIGVQTLEEPLRYKIGRISSTSDILKVIHQSKEMGFISCCDMIYGLPQQTIAGYIASIKQLIDIEIDGLSLYRFVVSHRNQEYINKKFKDYKKDELLNYICFHIGHQLLTEADYQKIFFMHFAKNDDNLYYRHLLRSEDLIAIGPTADGVIGSYRYRHPHLKEYLEANQPDIPAFEGGIAESKAAMRIKPATTQLMGGAISQKTIQKLNLEMLIKKWETCQVIEKSSSGSCQLLANGSWLIDQLLDEVDRMVNA
jgi:coproporphyrinogen III oxidase-like Fe-S oxidoreductase